MNISATKIKVAEKMFNLGIARITSELSGDYRGYKAAQTQFAKLAVENKDVFEKLKLPEVRVPLFSIYGFNMTKVALRNMLRIKTPIEKQFMELAKQIKLDKFVQGAIDKIH